MITSLGTARKTERKKKQLKSIGKNKRKKLTLQRSPAPKSLKDTSTKKQSPGFRHESQSASPEMKSPFKTPNIKDPSLRVISNAISTSTPEWYARRLKFSLDASPIANKAPKDMSTQNVSSLCSRDVQRKDQPVIDMSIVVDVSQEDTHQGASNIIDEMKISGKTDMLPKMSIEEGMTSVQSWIQSKLPSGRIQGEIRTEKLSTTPQKFNDHFENVREKVSEVKIDSSVDGSCNLIENSVVDPSPFQPLKGYITKRRMWRRTRRTVFNLSIDMFASTNKTTYDNQSRYWRESIKADKSRVVTSRINKSFPKKDASAAQGHFSISCDVTENDCSVRLLKSDKSYALNSICEKRSCIENASLDDSFKVDELSRELCVSLTLLSPEDVKKKTAQSDVDMFSGLSGLHSNCHIVEPKSPTSDNLCKKEESCVFSECKEHSEYLVSSQDIASLSEDDAVREKFLSVAEVLPEIVLKPCYVKLYRCELQTIADVTYTSQCNMDVSEDDTASVNESRESVKRSSDLQTVVQLPLSMLGKLDKITIRSSSKISQRSLESFVNEGKVLEGTLGKLREISTGMRFALHLCVLSGSV